MRRLLVLVLLLVPALGQAQSRDADGRRTYNGVTKGDRGATRELRSTSTRDTPTRTTHTAPPPRRDPYEDDALFVADLGLGMLGGAQIGAAGTGQGMARLRFGASGPWGLGVSTALSGNLQGFLSETDVGPVYFLDLLPWLELGVQPALLITAGSGRAAGVGLGARAYTTVDLGRRVALHLDPMLGQATSGFVYNLKAGGSYRVTPTIHARVHYDNRGSLGGGTGPLLNQGAHGVVASVGVRF